MNRLDYCAIAAPVLSLIDGIMTLPYWQLEGNPVVLSLGPTGMILVKLLVGLTLPAVWFLSVKGSGYEWTGKWTVAPLTVLYTIVVVTNGMVLLA